MSDLYTDGERVRFLVEVSVPAEQGEDFADALTGNDDDILLAAEEAMRSLMESHGEEVELSIVPVGEKLRLQLRNPTIYRPWYRSART